MLTISFILISLLITLLRGNLERSAGGWLAGLGDIDADGPRAAHSKVDLGLVITGRLWPGDEMICAHLLHCLHRIVECDASVGDELLALAPHNLERDAGGLVDKRGIGAYLQSNLVWASLGCLNGGSRTTRYDRIQQGTNCGYND